MNRSGTSPLHTSGASALTAEGRGGPSRARAHGSSAKVPPTRKTGLFWFQAPENPSRMAGQAGLPPEAGACRVLDRTSGARTLPAMFCVWGSADADLLRAGAFWKFVAVQLRLAVQGVEEDFEHFIDQPASLPRSVRLITGQTSPPRSRYSSGCVAHFEPHAFELPAVRHDAK